MILSNQVVCNQCEDRPYSAHRHDFKYCKCGQVAVDGGMDYLRRVGSGYTDISIVVSDEVYGLLCDAINDDTKNTLGKVCNLARVMRDDMGVDFNGY